VSNPREADADGPDPVVYEIVRHRLLMLNEENANAVITLSGSPVVVYGRDFNCAIMTPDGEYVFFGRNIKIHAGVMDLIVADVLRGSEYGAGVHDGDMFLCNDPWVGSGHQNDVVVICPVFAEGQIIFWLGNTLHHMDIGGSAVGGRSSRLTTSFDEPTIFPPFRIVEGDVLRPDLARMFVRQSRLPAYEALDLRAQVAGNLVAKRRLLDIVDGYGADATLAVAEQIIAEGSSRMQAILEVIPDGEWHDHAFLDGIGDRDRKGWRVGMRLIKRGMVLEFVDDGSDPQAAAPINCAFGAWRSGIICAVMSQLGPEVALAPGGAIRHLVFTPTYGTVLNANHPSPVNRATGLGLGLSAGMAMRLLADALSSDPARRPRLSAVSGSEPLIIAGLTGLGSDGSRYFRVFTDPTACGSGAFVGGDGDSTGGSTINLGAIIPNVEEYEAFGGFLYLYRREEPDTGGAGETRGGNAISYAVVPHRVETAVANVTGWGVAFPVFSGIFGGYPASARRVTVTRGSNVWEAVAAGLWPGAENDLSGEREIVPGRMEAIALGSSDVLVIVSGGGAGVGDPMDRPPEVVRTDVSQGAISSDHASRMYGVVFDGAGSVDERATAAQRHRVRKSRRESGEARSETSSTCPRCHELYGDDGGRDLRLTTDRSVPLEERMLASLQAQSLIDAVVTLVEHSCSNCGHLLSTELSLELDSVPPRHRAGRSDGRLTTP
jgi:N-methylhydantoinase B